MMMRKICFCLIGLLKEHARNVKPMTNTAIHVSRAGTTYSPTDLIDAYSVLTGSKPVKKKTEHYFFKLSECESFLSEWTQSDTLQKEALNKLQEWFKAGLADWGYLKRCPIFWL